MHHNHNDVASCPHCVTAKNQAGDKAFGEKVGAFLGVCGCLSCYVAMFPAILIGIVGIMGLSTSQTLNALNAYMNSILFQSILVVSILFLVIGLLRYGKLPLLLSLVGGFGIFASMNFYMTEWLFTFSFGVLAAAYYLASQQSKAQSLKITFVLLLAVVALGMIDVGRATLSAPPSSNSMPPAAIPQNMMNMM